MVRKRFAVGTAILFSLLVLPATFARKASGEAAALFKQKLSKDQEIAHALSRLTFGPRPGDVEQVRKLGLRKWIGQQLHPERIKENPILEARLKPLDSLDMEQKDLVETYPSPQVVVAVATGRIPMPADPEKRAVLERLAARYKNKLEKSKNNTGGAQLTPAEKTPLNELLTTEEMAALRKGTPEQKVSFLLSMPAEKLEKVLYSLPENARKGLFTYSPADVRRKMLLNIAPQQVLQHDLWEGKLYRAIYSDRQFEELLTDFWFNHFNVYLDKGADRYLVTAYEREAIRPYVLGNFRQMLEATAKSPAMLWYLDNWQSVAPGSVAGRARARVTNGKRKVRGLNENYARELMELHTLGVDGGYTQNDIVEVARCFTGWTIKDPRRGGDFEYNDRFHDKDGKVVLGHVIPAGGGMDDGLKILDILANHPSAARFISTKLAQRFVADQPSRTLIDAMAKTFQKTHGDLRQVIGAMIDSREFWSKGAYRAKVKSPLEMVASAVRATNADVTFAYGLANRISDLGQPLYKKQEPTGYPNANEEWINSAGLLARMNFALELAHNKLPGVKVDSSSLDGGPDRMGYVIGSPEFQRR